MASILWATRLVSKLTAGIINVGIGLTRTILRGLTSAMARLDENIGDVKDTMQRVDPGKAYGEWVTQFRNIQAAPEIELKLAKWKPNEKLTEDIMTPVKMRRAANYRYIFAALVNDPAGGTIGWKMFATYSNDLLSPNELREQFQFGYFANKYKNRITIDDIAIKRVHKWIPKSES